MSFRISLPSRLLLLCGITVMAFTGCKKSNDDITDGDGNIYWIVIIGTQEWLLENLKTNPLNDGTLILHFPSISDWAAAITPEILTARGQQDTGGPQLKIIQAMHYSAMSLIFMMQSTVTRQIKASVILSDALKTDLPM